jgi:beta-glucosidase
MDMPWMNKDLSPEERAHKLVAAMNFTEKASMTRGRSSNLPYTGHTAAIPRVGIPQLNCNDGPQGFRTDEHPGTSTQFPSALTVAASWDPSAIYNWGAAMGREFYQKGAQI